MKPAHFRGVDRKKTLKGTTVGFFCEAAELKENLILSIRIAVYYAQTARSHQSIQHNQQVFDLFNCFSYKQGVLCVKSL